MKCRECGEQIAVGEVVYHEECLDPMVEELRAALGRVWMILINQQCQAGTWAWNVADEVLDQTTKDALRSAEDAATTGAGEQG